MSSCVDIVLSTCDGSGSDSSDSMTSTANDGLAAGVMAAGGDSANNNGNNNGQTFLGLPGGSAGGVRPALRRRSILGPPSLFPSQRYGSLASEAVAVASGGAAASESGTAAADEAVAAAVAAAAAAASVSEANRGAARRRAAEVDAIDVAMTIADLDFYYGLVKRQLLRYQSCTTGLFPEVSSEPEVASVRSSIYANMAVWSLHQAYKRIDDDRGKTYELGQSCVLGMRGILICWMRQSSRLEAFKFQQTPANALHSLFNLDTGFEVYGTDVYNHLQIDVVSLYLLFLVQVISSGLQVVYDMDEVHFVQNLIYYVERAYRTPDFGMWERGTKDNNRTCEVNASSIGMAKAALEAINGINLFGDRGAAWSVAYVDIDAHNRNRSIFETLLPRESDSREVDASLLPTVSWPAFATHDRDLYAVTKSKVTANLEGRYGFMRFARDGFGTVVERELADSLPPLAENGPAAGGIPPEGARVSADGRVIYYPEGKISEFDKIECEWPMFYAYMVIDGIFKNNEAQVEKYHELLKKRVAFDENGDPVLPQFFYVGSHSLKEMRQSQNSRRQQPHQKQRQQQQHHVHRLASNDGCSSSDLHLWSQSLLIISDLLSSQRLEPLELDPIRRHLPSYSRPKWWSRYSAFETTSVDLVVQVVTIAESIRLQSVLATYGIQTQTPNEIEPVQIWSQWDLVKVYQLLGKNKALKLSGRPPRPIGSLGTSKVYRMCGQTVICYPLIMSASDFYLSHDMALLTDDIKSELKFVSRCWRLSGRPTVCILVTESNMRDPQFSVLLNFLAELRSGCVDGVKIRIGRLQNLLASSCLEHLDFLQQVRPEDDQKFGEGEEEHGEDEDEFRGEGGRAFAAKLRRGFGLKGDRGFRQLETEHGGYQSLTDVPVRRSSMATDPEGDRRQWAIEYESKSTEEISSAVTSCSSLYGAIQLLGILHKREGGGFMVGDLSVTSRLEMLNRKAGASRHWAAVRYSSSLLRQTVDSISPFVTQILVSNKQVTVGTIGLDYSLFDKPMTPAQIKEAIYTKVQPFNVIGAVLQQELILYCGKLIATNPELFAGILKIRIGWILHGLELYRQFDAERSVQRRKHGHHKRHEHKQQEKIGDHDLPDTIDPIETCSPSEVRRLLFRVLKESKALQLTYSSAGVDRKLVKDLESPLLSVFQVRQINGCLNRVPDHFYMDVWRILKRSPGGIRIGQHHLPQEPTLTQRTSTDTAFAHMVENMWNAYLDPAYKQLLVELFCVLAAILKRNPELRFSGGDGVDAEELVQEAVRMFKEDEGLKEEDLEAAQHMFYQRPVATTSGYLARSVVNSVLKGAIMHKVDEETKDSKGGADYSCPVQ